MVKKSKAPVNEAPYGDIGFIEASAHALFLHDIKNMLSAIVPKDIAKKIKIEEHSVYSTKYNKDFKVSELWFKIKDVTIIVSYDFEDYKGLNVWIQNDDEGEGATVGVVKSRDAVFQFIKAVLILNKVIKS